MHHAQKIKVSGMHMIHSQLYVATRTLSSRNCRREINGATHRIMINKQLV